MASCAVQSPGAEHAESRRRLRYFSPAQALCSRLLRGFVNPSAVHEQGLFAESADLWHALQYISCWTPEYWVIQALFTTFQFQFPLVVALAQMMTMVPVCYIVAKPKIDWTTAKAVFPLALVNTLNVVFGLVGKTHQFTACPNDEHLSHSKNVHR